MMCPDLLGWRLIPFTQWGCTKKVKRVHFLLEKKEENGMFWCCLGTLSHLRSLNGVVCISRGEGWRRFNVVAPAYRTNTCSIPTEAICDSPTLVEEQHRIDEAGILQNKKILPTLSLRLTIVSTPRLNSSSGICFIGNSKRNLFLKTLIWNTPLKSGFENIKVRV